MSEIARYIDPLYRLLFIVMCVGCVEKGVFAATKGGTGAGQEAR